MTTTKQKNARRMKKREKLGQGASLFSFQKFLSENKNLTAGYVPGITELTLEEVAKHNTPDDMWTVYRGNVYNVGPFLDYHPGGEAELLRGVGIDCTELYDKVHPWVNAEAVLGQLKLGPLRASHFDKSRPVTPDSMKTTVDAACISPLLGSSKLNSRTPKSVDISPKQSKQAPTMNSKLDSRSVRATTMQARIRSRELLDARQAGIFRIFTKVDKENIA